MSGTAQPLYAMSPIAALISARALIAAPQSWIQGEYSDAPLRSEFCSCWCAAGAILQAAGHRSVAGIEDDHWVTETLAAFAAAAAIEIEGQSKRNWRAYDIVSAIAAWNDDSERVHAHVVAAFDAAIEATEARS